MERLMVDEMSVEAVTTSGALQKTGSITLRREP